MADDNQAAEITAEGTRALLLSGRPSQATVQRQHWAIIVGISKYQNADLNLRYAHNDAQALYEVIRTPRGGGFDEERIKILIDEQATTDNVTRAAQFSQETSQGRYCADLPSLSWRARPAR